MDHNSLKSLIFHKSLFRTITSPLEEVLQKGNGTLWRGWTWHYITCVVPRSYRNLMPYIEILEVVPWVSPQCTWSSWGWGFLCHIWQNKLNKQGDNIQPWCTPFPIWNHSVVPCPVLTVVSWHAYRFLKRQVRWSGIPISFRIFHSLLWSTQSKALA